MKDQPDGEPATEGAQSDTVIAAVLAGLDADPAARLVEIDRDGAAHSIPFLDIWKRARRSGEALAAMDDRGRPVVLATESAADMICGLWAAIIACRPVLPIHVHALSGVSGDLGRKVRRASDLLTSPRFVAPARLLDRLAENLDAPATATLEDLADGPVEGRETGEEAEAALRRRGPQSENGLELLFWTSGATAAPKIARVDARTLLCRILMSRTNAKPATSINHYPLDGITSGSVCYPNGSDSIYLQPDGFARDPADLLRLVEAYRVVGLGISSSAAWRVLESIGDRRFDVSSLRRIGVGTERIVPSVFEAFVAKLSDMGATDLALSFGYGMTEAGLICATGGAPREEALLDLRRNEEHPSVGPPRPGFELRIVGPDGEKLSEGEEGDIEVWNPDRLFSGYLGVDPSEQPFAADGWLQTGDRGFLDAGSLRITGRSKGTVIVNGRKVSLATVETALREVEGLDHIRLAALPVRSPGAATEELAVFSALSAGADGARIAAEVRRTTMRVAGIPARHLIAVPAAEFPTTASGKIARGELAEGFAEGRWTRIEPAPGVVGPATPAPGDLAEQLAELWRDLLKLSEEVRPDADFYALGGDSFAAASIVFAAEELTGKRLDVDRFFRDPTVATMARLLGDNAQAETALPDSGSAPGAERLMHRLAGYVASWKGDRMLPDSMVVGSHTEGARPPLFWVLQSEREMHALAEHLGEDQPLYAMRSGVRLVGSYTTDILDALVNRYLWELLALPTQTDYVLGGNCQGGIVALALARRLRQLGRPPRRLILLEWSFSFGRYDGPTLLLYGDESPVAAQFTGEAEPEPRWRKDFPRAETAALPAKHGGFFRPKCLPHFSRHLLAETEPPRPAPAQQGWLDRLRDGLRQTGSAPRNGRTG